MAKLTSNMVPIVSKLYCSTTENVFMVRRRPHVVNGGGFVVVDSNQKIHFRVDGCGLLGKNGELMLKDGDGNELLLIRRKGGIVEALSINKRWKGYKVDFDGSAKLVFCLKEQNSCILMNNPVKISIVTDNNKHQNHKEFIITGDFPARACSLVCSNGNIVAEVGVKEEIERVMAGKDLYQVLVKPGIDQAFVFGVIAILDYIYDGSTRC